MYVCPECGESSSVSGTCTGDGSVLSARGDDPLLGELVGLYRVARILGKGGMGLVYMAVHADIGSRVAIKVLHHDKALDPRLVDRFFAEARAVNQIRHENIVNVIHLDTLPDGRPYIVMEHLDGEPLAGVIKHQSPLPLGGVLRLVGQILGALEAVHHAGFVHRDLKPDNIFVSPHGRGTILDFGIAKLMPELSNATGPTRTGSLLGTPHYMAPEQAKGQPVDARADIYAMGIIVFEAVTGIRPFVASSLYELLRQHIDEPPPRPSALRPDLPLEYEQVILCAMAKDPAQRFQSATALANALMQLAPLLPPAAWAVVSPRGGEQEWPDGMPGLSTPASGESASPTFKQSGAAPAPVASLSPPSQPGGTGQERPIPPAVARPRPRRRVATWVAGAGLVAFAGAVGGLMALQGKARPGGSAGDAGPRVVQGPAPETGRPNPEDDAQKRTLEAMENARRLLGVDVGHIVYDDAGRSRYIPPDTYQPEGFDPTRFDVLGFLPHARAKAREHYEDAELARIDAQGIYPDGRADLTLSTDLMVIYNFSSPSRSGRPRGLPIGVDHKPNCLVQIWATLDGVRMQPLDGWQCSEPPIGTPSCSAAQVWKLAIAQGAPADNAVATMSYYRVEGERSWHVQVGDQYSGLFGDSCSQTRR